MTGSAEPPRREVRGPADVDASAGGPDDRSSGHRPGASRVLVIIPTYCEAATLPRALAAVGRHVPDADVLVVDDASPDGTGDVADAASARDPRVHVLHRPGKAGLGAAYVHGFRWGLARGYDVLVEMDADGSHRA